MLTVNAFPLRQQHVDISALIPQPASNDLNQSGVAIGLSDKYQLVSGGILSVVAQYMRFDSNAHGQGTEDMLITPEGYGGNYFNWWTRRASEFQIVPSFQFPQMHWHGEHQIRVGADIDYRSFFGLTGSQPIQILRQDNTLTQQITFGPQLSQTPSDSSFGRICAGPLGARFAMDSRSRRTYRHRDHWVACGVCPTGGFGLRAGAQWKDRHSRGRWPFLRSSSLARGQFCGKSHAHDFRIRFDRRTARLSDQLHQSLCRRPKSLDGYHPAKPTGHNPAQLHLES